jgi:ABC-type sugar transport system ATPase subunit
VLHEGTLRMLVEMKDIVVDYGPVRAVNRVSITIGPGEILGLLGENGAGKSTLMKVLAGAIAPTRGEIVIDGAPKSIPNAKVAGQAGIRFIHQELNLCEDLKVFENMFLGEELRRATGLLDTRTMIARCREALGRVRADIDPEAVVADLQAAQKQLVECAKALLFDARLIIMDEPSTALTLGETENLLETMRKLKAEGVSFIYISHKMPELFAICERYYVLRDGALVAEGSFADVDENSITELMIGRQLAHDAFDDHTDHTRPEILVKAENLSGPGFEEVSFELQAGQVLAVTGLQGSGRDQLADALFGAAPFDGTLTVKGRRVRSGTSIRSFMRRGVAMVPRMRKERGIHNDLSIMDNHNMAYLNARARSPWISRSAASERYERQRKALSIKAGNVANPITSLSGGNQQKVILGKWLEASADVLLLDNPTQGIDVGTKFEIYHLILGLARNGKAIIVFSGEPPEIAKVADVCIVMFKGRVNAVLERNQITERDLMFYSTGANLRVS